MPWRKETVEDQRGQFILKVKQRGYSVAEACRVHGISRPTGYKWIERYEAQGFKGLNDRSRRPKGAHPDSTPNATLCEIVKVRNEHPHWGGKTIRAYLKREGVVTKLPHARTIDRLLKRAGFVTPRARQHRVILPEREVVSPTMPNQVWTTDFKGWWTMGNSKKCYPLTVRDAVSRFLIAFEALDAESLESAKTAFIKAFNAYGLPLYILSDNGKPFANTQNPWGLTRLSVWWLKLGITPLRIAPGKPYQNGAHERMHLDMARQLEHKPEKNLSAEQRRFDRWRYDFNSIRPHQALNMRTPEELYTPSTRSYVPDPIYLYPDNWETRYVSAGGQFIWGKRSVQFSRAFSGESIAIEPVDASTVRLWFTDFFLGTCDRQFQSPITPPKYLKRLQIPGPVL